MNTNAEKAKNIIAAIANNNNFSNLNKSAQSGEFVQFNEKEFQNYSLHYEIVTAEGLKDKSNPDLLFVEYHVENRGFKRNANEAFIERFKEIFSSYSYNINEYWQSGGRVKPMAQGFSVCYEKDGISANDENAVSKLEKQLNDFFAAVDKSISKFLYWESQRPKLELLKKSKQLILTGAPGTGKTYTATELAKYWIEENNGTIEENCCKVQFHSNYDYSDFIIGLKPHVVNGTVSFAWKDGIFKEFANKALKERQLAKQENRLANPYIFIIDEINRADLSRVFGEVFSLLEEEYRYPNKETGITLPNGENFILPDNLYIIGTMNDIDRSVESIDFALRRRFSWKEVTAQESESIVASVINGVEQTKLLAVMRTLNCHIGAENKPLNNICLNLGDEYQLGGAYFLNFTKYKGHNNPEELLWKNHIAIILNEYLRGRKEKEQLLRLLEKEFYDTWNN